MKRKIKKTVLVLLSLSMLFAFAACNNTNKKEVSSNDNAEMNAALSGFINAGGSTSVEKAAIKLLEEFSALNPDVSYAYDSSGSSTGIKNVHDGTYKIGFASRELKEGEKKDVVFKPIAMDGIAVCVNPNNSVTNLSMSELKGIYTGEIKNWKELGGTDADIVVVSRENGSGTRAAFEELSGVNEKLIQKATIKSGNGEVAAYVNSEANAIGYISFVTLDLNRDKLKGLDIEGIVASIENVQTGKYKLARPFNMIYIASELNDVEKKFIDFIFTNEGQSLIEEAGAIRIK